MKNNAFNPPEPSDLVKMSEIDSALLSNDKLVSVLHERLDELRDRLEPVLRRVSGPGSVGPEASSDFSGSRSPLACKLENIAEGIHPAIAKLDDILERLAL